MRFRASIIAAVFAVMLAVTISGCGSKMTNNTQSGSQATQSTGQSTSQTNGATGPSSKPAAVTLASLTNAYNACVARAKQVPNSNQGKQIEANCKAAYESAKKSIANVGKAMSDAYKNCVTAASAIQNATAKSKALEACAKLKQ